MYNRKRRKIYKKFWQLLKKGQTNWECFYTNPCNRIPRLLPSNLIIMNRKPYFKTFQLFPNENSNQTPFRQFQPGDLDKENLQRPEFGDPLDKLRPPEGTKPTAPDEPTPSFCYVVRVYAFLCNVGRVYAFLCNVGRAYAFFRNNQRACTFFFKIGR